MSEPSNGATAPVSAEPAATRKCPGCGEAFPAGGRGMGKNFHSDACRQRFHNTSRAHGFVLAPLVKAWTSTRHAKEGTREAAICTFARGQITEIARMFLDADDEAKRDPVAYVGALMDSGFIYADRRR